MAHRPFPRNLSDVVYVLALRYGWAPSTIWDLSAEDLMFWFEGIERVGELEKIARSDRFFTRGG